MEYLKFILYGLIQGLTEFIPVSSTAHLKTISHLLGIDNPGPSLSAVMQIGSILAILWYFKDDIFTLKKNLKKKFFGYLLNKKLSKSIFIGTIPIVLLGGCIKLFVPIYFYQILSSNKSIGIVSLVMAFFMYLADCARKSFINIKNHKYSDSLLIGISQAFAIFPGVSRSGFTISTALLAGWDRKSAVKFSFLLGIPAISLAAIVELISAANDILINFYPLIVGLTTTFLSSLVAIDFLFKYLPSNGLKIFIIYRVIFGIIILLNL